MPTGARLVALLALLAPFPCCASLGDVQPAFALCLRRCAQPGCRPPAALALRLTRWGCADECKHACILEAEGDREAAGLRPLKYFGKWPFVRVLGLQEPASVALSLANGAAHVVGLRRLRAEHARLATPSRLRRLWGAHAGLSLCAWAASAVFHGRDTPATTAVDYFCADALLVYALWAAISRGWLLLHPPGKRRLVWGVQRSALAWPLAVLLSAAFAAHCYRMAFVHFDYGLNVRLAVAAGCAQSAALVAWTRCSLHPARRPLLRTLLLLHASSLLELVDFPPAFGVVDAHAAWHGATLPLVPRWYDFLVDDARHVAATAAAAGCAREGEGGREEYAAVAAAARGRRGW